MHTTLQITTLGLQDALTTVQHLLQWAGAIPAWLAMQTKAVVHERLLAEVSMAALVVVLPMLPALLWVECLHGLRVALRSKPTPKALPAVPLLTDAGVLSLESPTHGQAIPIVVGKKVAPRRR